jgi:hypothetical protein
VRGGASLRSGLLLHCSKERRGEWARSGRRGKRQPAAGRRLRHQRPAGPTRASPALPAARSRAPTTNWSAAAGRCTSQTLTRRLTRRTCAASSSSCAVRRGPKGAARQGVRSTAAGGLAGTGPARRPFCSTPLPGTPVSLRAIPPTRLSLLIWLPCVQPPPLNRRGRGPQGGGAGEGGAGLEPRRCRAPTSMAPPKSAQPAPPLPSPAPPRPAPPRPARPWPPLRREGQQNPAAGRLRALHAHCVHRVLAGRGRDGRAQLQRRAAG